MRSATRSCALCAIALATCIATGASEACAQAAPPQPTQPAAPPSAQPVPSQPGQIFTIDRDGKIHRIGDACIRKSDKKPGVVKRDACARWYCSLPDAQDIIELRPNMAAEMGCAWRLYGTHCRCGPPDKPKAP